MQSAERASKRSPLLFVIITLFPTFVSRLGKYNVRAG